MPHRKEKIKCPLCKKISASQYFPFCSLSCKEQDLNNWITGKYFFPSGEQASLEEGPLPEGTEDAHDEDLLPH